MRPSRRQGIWSGLFVAVMVTAALIGILFFGWKVAGLPFVPFDAFDWLTRLLPGRVIAFGIGTMVTVIRTLNLGPTSETAKTAEQVMAISGLFVSGVAGGVILFAILRTMRGAHAVTLGMVLGLILGVPAMLVSLQASQTSSVGSGARVVWVLGVFLAWGGILGRAEQRLIGIEAATGDAGRAAEAPESGVERIDRRRFLVRLGGSAAAITVAGAVVGDLADARRREALMMAGGQPMPWSTTHSLPNSNDPGRPPPGKRAELTTPERHYRIDINTIPPAVEEQRWRLNIIGLVEKPLALTLEALRSYEPMQQVITLTCIANTVAGDFIGYTR